jgi:hypothetical protein
MLINLCWSYSCTINIQFNWLGLSLRRVAFQDPSARLRIRSDYSYPDHDFRSHSEDPWQDLSQGWQPSLKKSRLATRDNQNDGSTTQSSSITRNHDELMDDVTSTP